MKDETEDTKGDGRKPRSERQTTLRFRWAYIPLLVFMALFAYAFLQKTQEMHRLSAEQATLLAENRRILTDNRQMQRANAYRRTPQYEIERARSLLGWTAPGETSIQVQLVKHPVVVVRKAPTRDIIPAGPTWQMWWNAFFD
jgi:cell division protein FtsB